MRIKMNKKGGGVKNSRRRDKKRNGDKENENKGRDNDEENITSSLR